VAVFSPASRHATSIQRLSCSGWYSSATRVKPSFSVNQAIADLVADG
jgi:hypothetical protein